jgi:hypothetical protein
MFFIENIYSNDNAKIHLQALFVCVNFNENSWHCLQFLKPSGESDTAVSISMWQRDDQGCQMVYFQTKNSNLGQFYRVLQWKMLVNVMAIWDML